MMSNWPSVAAPVWLGADCLLCIAVGVRENTLIKHCLNYIPITHPPVHLSEWSGWPVLYTFISSEPHAYVQQLFGLIEVWVQTRINSVLGGWEQFCLDLQLRAACKQIARINPSTWHLFSCRTARSSQVRKWETQAWADIHTCRHTCVRLFCSFFSCDAGAQFLPNVVPSPWTLMVAFQSVH